MFICYYCGIEKEDPENSLEHIIPESCGGGITTTLVCNECNSKANREIDNFFKDEWFISWDRAILGLEGKRGKVHKVLTDVTSENGKQMQILINEEGIIPITKPEVELDYINNKGTILADKRFVKNVLKDVRKKVGKKGLKLMLPEVLPEPSKEHPGFVNMKISVDLKNIRREQVKIILGLACKFIPNFTNSQTATLLRDYLWDSTGASQIKKLTSGLFPYELNKSIPSFYKEGNVIYSTQPDGMEMEVLLSTLDVKLEHLFAYYPNRGKVRLYLSIFGHLNCYIDTIENYDTFFKGPVQPISKAIINYPKEKRYELININGILSMTGSMASAKLAGFLSSQPRLFDSIKNLK
ncbi:HNH endonuclease [Mesobacillus maritimus]|uniref:HNH endonuclease n=1 Tax=Mesobacillus maritimus TaxID=1643336 RepID=UPI00203D2812|nr:HNH endonuclease [Mesobacillus maritimus]MCM3584264.1 HNH endonuclease [Mesobacillus maritimus]